MSPSVLFAVSLLVYGAPLDPIAFEPGAGLDEVVRKLAADGHAPERKRSTDPQALAEYLIASRLLETLNRLRVTPIDDKRELDISAFAEIVRAKREDRESIFVFSGGQAALRFAMTRIRVPVDASRDRATGDSPLRLSALRTELEAFRKRGFALEPKEKDRWGNANVWGGANAKGTVLEAWYLAEDDELRVLLHR